MTPSPPLSALLDSAIARLAAEIMSHDAQIDTTIEGKVKRLCELIRKASDKRRAESLDVITQILKSLDTNAILPILSTIAGAAPSMMLKLQQDKMIADRIKHIYRVAEMAQILSKESIRTARGGVRLVQQRIFETASK